MFRCRECSRVLKVPQTVLEMRGESQPLDSAVGGAAAGAAVAGSTGSGTGAATVAVPRVEGATAGMGAGVTAGTGADALSAEPATRRAARSGSERRGMMLPLRAAVWLIALMLGFVLAVVPLYLLGLFTSEQASNVLLEEGFDRISGLLLLLPLWAATTATLAHFTIESRSR